MSPDVAASIKARLLAQARQKGEAFELYLVRYTCERFLYRLGVSPLRDRCILKGAGLLSIWMADPYRSTRDVDLLGLGPSDEESVRATIETICAEPCPEDGLRFDMGSLEVSPIREEQEYQGQRAVMLAHLGTARIRLHVDFGFGDAVVPGADECDFPTILSSLPAPRLRTYPRVVVVAEKFQAMVRFGLANSRMKDFHDVWALSSTFAFDGSELQRAVIACFESRRTIWSSEVPSPLGMAMYTDASMQARWSAYLGSGAFRDAPPSDFDQVGELVRAFLGPMRESIIAGQAFKGHWMPGGPWT
jgi:hypothetical protein